MKCSSQDSSGRSLGGGALIAYDGNEQVGDGGCAQVAKGGELVAINAIEQENAATEVLPFVNWHEGARCGELVGMNHHFRVARLEFFHAATQYDAATIDEHDVGKHVLYFFDLMRGYDDGAFAIEVVVQQRIVELFAIEDVQTERRFLQDK